MPAFRPLSRAFSLAARGRSREAASPSLTSSAATDPHRHLRIPRLRLGDPAYDFALPRVDPARCATAELVRLSDYLGRQPVLLVFGSCTCGRFVRARSKIEALAATYEDRVAFFLVYGREAHPPGHPPPGDTQRFTIEDPLDFAGRVRVASRCAESLPIRLPLLVDGMDDRVTAEYGGRPAAARLIGASGKLVYLSAPDRSINGSELEREIRRETRLRAVRRVW